jgi:predicted nucleic acid-binding protein
LTGQATTADTSLVVPALLSWHESHKAVRDAVRDVTRLPGHVLCADDHRRLLETLARSEIRGKSAHDALIGATAASAGYALLTRDQRASRIYQAAGASAVHLP